MPTILDFDGLAKALQGNIQTLRASWRDLPHFFIYEGRDRRSARFILEDVVDHFRKNGVNYYGNRKVPNKGRAKVAGRDLGRQATPSQQGGVQKEKGRGQVAADHPGTTGTGGKRLLQFDAFANVR